MLPSSLGKARPFGRIFGYGEGSQPQFQRSNSKTSPGSNPNLDPFGPVIVEQGSAF